MFHDGKKNLMSLIDLLLFFPVVLKEVTCTMTAEMKYTPRVLKLNANSSIEESTIAFDEMAPFWEKVNKHGTPSTRGILL